MTTKRTWSFALLATALTVTLAASSLVHGKGKPPKDDPPPPDAPPVQYQITWVTTAGWATLQLEALNNAGTAVGYADTNGGIRVAVRFTPGVGLSDLNAEIDPESGWDLEYARDINTWGQIVGQGWINGERRAYRYRPAGSDGDGLPEVNTIDDLGKLDPTDTRSSAYGINDFGEVCGRSRDASTDTGKPYYYSDLLGMVPIKVPVWSGAAARINNNGQVLGTSDGLAYRYSADTDTPEYFYSPDGTQTVSAFAINDDGHFVGKANFLTGRKGKNSTEPLAYIYRGGAGLEDLGAPKFLSPQGINNWGDVVLRNSGGSVDGMVYLQAHDAFVKLGDAVTGAEAETWHALGLARPLHINDGGQIAGWLGGNGTENWFILTPIEAAP